MAEKLKVIIIGGYGTFGGRLVELIENEPRLEIIVAGRSLEKARIYCQSRIKAAALLVPALFDRDKDVAAQLDALRASLVVDASGPFQAYGENRYHVVKACLQLGVNYIDLADSAEFVTGINQFEAAALAKDIFILSGVSSFPVLTAAAVRHLSAGIQKVDAIRGGIAPSPYAGVGKNVLLAIAGYAGQKTLVRRGGTMVTACPLTEATRYTIAAPGRVPLREILFSLVEVPDLRLLAEIWPSAQDIWMGAGPVPEILHQALIHLAWAVRRGWLRSLTPLAGLMDIVTRHVRWGENRGGMFVAVDGRDAAGNLVKKSWHLLAEGRDGPMIPSMAAEIIIRRHLTGFKIPGGARTAVADISLKDYTKAFSGRSIFTGTRDDLTGLETPLYQRILGSAWDDLPAELRTMHSITSASAAATPKQVEGVSSIERGRNPLARLACLVMGFPPAGENISVTVTFTVEDGVEKWTRDFAGKEFTSLQYQGKGAQSRLFIERFGPLAFAMALTFDDGKLRLVMRGWRAFGIPLPMWLCVRSDSYECLEDGRFHFNVDISHPLIGSIVHYKGWLLPKS